MNPSEILTAAAALITKETWAQGYVAWDIKGHAAYANEPGAVKWCLLGACCKILNLALSRELPKDLLGYIIDGICDVEPNIMGWDLGANPTPTDYSRVIGAWNDDQASFKDIRGALLAAVQYAEQDEGHG